MPYFMLLNHFMVLLLLLLVSMLKEYTCNIMGANFETQCFYMKHFLSGIYHTEIHARHVGFLQEQIYIDHNCIRDRSWILSHSQHSCSQLRP